MKKRELRADGSKLRSKKKAQKEFLGLKTLYFDGHLDSHLSLTLVEWYGRSVRAEVSKSFISKVLLITYLYAGILIKL